MFERSGRMLSVCWAWIRAVLGVDECLLLLALGLIAAGFWYAWKPGAFLVPGAILLWLVMPARAGFIVRHPTPDEKPKEKR